MKRYFKKLSNFLCKTAQRKIYWKKRKNFGEGTYNPLELNTQKNANKIWCVEKEVAQIEG